MGSEMNGRFKKQSRGAVTGGPGPLTTVYPVPAESTVPTRAKLAARARTDGGDFTHPTRRLAPTGGSLFSGRSYSSPCWSHDIKDGVDYTQGRGGVKRNPR
jgi:hypothetical protein